MNYIFSQRFKCFHYGRVLRKIVVRGFRDSDIAEARATGFFFALPLGYSAETTERSKDIAIVRQNWKDHIIKVVRLDKKMCFFTRVDRMPRTILEIVINHMHNGIAARNFRCSPGKIMNPIIG
ncbi:hypothetical protein CT19431_U10005 [Cupriavidus taiwanensis]|nr:hypothetical protein CT19431_U10005 [Cupriavidus taiwanensis]